MSEFVLSIIVSTIALVGLVLFVLFHIYRVLNNSLANATIGGVYNFEYEQPLTGESERYLAKILDVYSLSEDSIRRLNKRSNYRRNDSNFIRTSHLVTAQTPDGRIRNFYAERTKNVRRPIFGRVLFKSGLASRMF